MNNDKIEEANEWFDNLDSEHKYYMLAEFVLQSKLSYSKLWRLYTIEQRLEIYNLHKRIEEIEGVK